MLEHHDEGALGLVLNRPSPEELGEPLDAWVELQSDPSLVFVGGPVEPDALIALARVASRCRRWPRTTTRRATSPRSAATSPRPTWPPTRLVVVDTISALRVFRGYAGWGPGQLEGEIEAGAWLVLDPDPTDLFTDDARRPLAHRAAPPARPPAWLADAPDDLAAN